MARKRKRKGSFLTNNAVVRYFQNTIAELRKVHWPTRKEAWNLTKLVLGVTIVMAIFLGLLDYLFALELAGLFRRDIVAIVIGVVFLVASGVVALLLSRQRV